MKPGSNDLGTRRYLFARPLRGGNRLALWLVLFALLPLSLLGFGVQVTREASVESADAYQSSSLRFRSLLLYGVTNQQRRNEEWRPILTKMSTVRESLRARYPRAVGQTDGAWNAFSGSLQRSGRLDWPTALQMRDAADWLTQSIEDAEKRKDDQANGLFLAGIAATAMFAGLALVGSRKGQRSEQARARTEEALRLQTERAREQTGLLELARDAILVRDMHDAINFWNNGAERTYGWTKEEAMGQVPQSLLQTQFPIPLEQIDRMLAEQGRWEGQMIHTRRDGEQIVVESRIAVLKDPLGQPVAIMEINRDITERKAMEEELRYSEARFHAFVNNASMVAWITDADGRIEYLNEPYCAMIGRSLEDCLGKTFFDLYPADSAQILLDNIRHVARTGQHLETVETVPLPDGKRHHFLVQKFLIRDPDGGILVGGSAIDITERRETEQALHDNEERLREAQRVAGIGSWERDLATNRILWSEEMFRIYRFDFAEGVPDIERIMARTHPDDREAYVRNLETTAESGDRYEFDLRLLFDDGTVTWGHAVGNVERDETGTAVRRFGTFMNVTEHKAVEEAVRKSQASLNHAQAMAHLGSWERDYRAGTMSWSDEMFRMCGLEPGEIVPSVDTLFAYTHPLDQKRGQECMRQAMQSGRGAEIEVRLVGADGVLRHVFIRTEILKDEAGQPIGSRGTLTDVTERVKAFQEQTKFASLIEHSSDFIAMASLDGALLSLNPAGCKLVGWESVEGVAKPMLSEFMPREVWEWMRQGVLPMVMRDDRWEGECQLVNLETGKTHDMQASFFLIRNPVSGEPMCLATVQRDITDQKWLDAQLKQNLVLVQEQNVLLEWQREELASANAHLQALATTDGLTGAKNHRAFQEKLAEEFKRAERTHESFSLILLDVDKFKRYNDSFGHPEGDRALKQVVQVLHEVARETDFVARYGGEEFIVLLPDTGVDGAMETAERFRIAIEAWDWPLRQVTASFGVATLNATTETGQQLVDMADKALYASKEAGRNRVTLSDGIPVV